MYQLTYEISTLAPILITSNVGDINMVSTQNFIPGTSILGYFAGKYLSKKPNEKAHEDDNFRDWFLNGGLAFLNAYIVFSDKDHMERCLPIPFSLQKNKNDEADIADLLFLNENDVQRTTMAGFGLAKDEAIYPCEVQKQINFHHTRGKNRSDGHAKEGDIFNYESINSEQTFQGMILGDEEALKTFINLFGKEFEGRLGRSKGTQYGHVQFKIVGDPIVFAGEIADTSNAGSQAFSLTLLSDTVIYNQNGFSTLDIKDLAKEIAAAMEIDESCLEIEQDKCFIKATDIENFVSVWLLRKPSDRAFTMGSCLSVKITKDIQDLDAALGKMVTKGLGERKGEGFGRVAANWQKSDQYSMATPEDLDPPDLKNIPMPTLLRQKLVEMMQERIKQKIITQANDDQCQFKNIDKLPPSLLSRLELIFKNSDVKSAGDEYKLIESLKPEEQEQKKKGLRKTALKNLEKVNNSQTKLWQFITEDYLLYAKGEKKGRLFRKYLRNLSLQEKAFLEELKYEIENDPEFCAILYQTYWQSFFYFMRKAAKQGRKLTDESK